MNNLEKLEIHERILELCKLRASLSSREKLYKKGRYLRYTKALTLYSQYYPRLFGIAKREYLNQAQKVA